MNEKETINRIRGLGFMAGVLERQSREPLCSICISYALTLEESREALSDLKFLASEIAISEEFAAVLQEADKSIMALTVPSEPERQRKVGRCHFPDKACFVKRARKVFLFFKEKKQDRT